MYLAEKTPAWFWRCGLALFALQAFVFLFGIGSMRMGYWDAQEPRFVTIMLLGALTSLWFWRGLTTAWIQGYRSLPGLLWIIVSWLGWQCVVTLLAADSTRRSWFGPPDHGEGTAWYVCITLLTALAYLLWQREPLRRPLFYTALAALVSMYALQTFTPEKGLWRVNFWADYLAWGIGWIWVVAHLTWPTLTTRKMFRIGLAASIALVLTHNLAGAALLAGAFIVSQGAAEIAADRKKPYLSAPRWLRHLACLACLVPLFYTFAGYESSHFFERYNTSLSMRMHFNGEAVRGLLHEPSHLWLGTGWNSFQDIHVKYSLFGNISLFEDGQFNPNLTSLFGGAQHSHNQPLEALVSFGVLGIVIYFALNFYIIRHIPERLFWRVVPIHVALVTLSYFWFYLSFLGAFLGLYWATLAHTCATEQKTHAHPNPASRPFSLLFIPLALILLWTAISQFRAMLYAEWLHNVVFSPYQNYSMQDILEDSARGGERFRAVTTKLLSNHSANQVYQVKRVGTPPPQAAEDAPLWIEKLLDASHLMSADPRVGTNIRATDLILQFYLQMPYATSEQFDRARAKSFSLYPSTVLRAAHELPLRDDLASPYLYHLERAGDEESLSLILPRLLDANPNHRVALWLMGKRLIQNPESTSLGEELMQRAREAGVITIYPVEDQKPDF